MAGLKEFKTRIESDAAFAAKFKGAQTDEQLIALAKAEGYDLEQLSDDELDKVAGGQLILHLANTSAIANENDPSKKLVVGSDKLVYSVPRR